jgi:hypothetical protein
VVNLNTFGRLLGLSALGSLVGLSWPTVMTLV